MIIETHVGKHKYNGNNSRVETVSKYKMLWLVVGIVGCVRIWDIGLSMD